MIKYKSTLRNIFILFVFILAFQTIRADSLKVLFLGNSHTFSNDLPQLTTDLALSNGDTLFYLSNTPGGCTLGHPENGHLFNSTSLSLIDSLSWDYVILQEHSLFAVIDYYREKYMYSGAKSLDSLIKLNNECTETIIQLIWGKKYGGLYCMNEHCSVDFEDFAHMQDSLTSKYLRLADSLSFTVAPSGVAWKEMIQNGDPIELFSPDNSHPNLAGSYLIACVYYATLFQESPVNLPFTGGLNSEDALLLQQAAHNVVFENTGLWNINANKPLAGFEISQIENTVYCTDTSSNADSYLWDFGDGMTDTIANPVHTYDASGMYIISQLVSNTCHSSIAYDTLYINVTNQTEIPTNNLNIWITYGNEKGVYNVHASKSQIQDFRIFDVNGRLRYTESQIQQKEFELNIKHLPPGIYIIVNYTGNDISTIKITHY